MMKDFPYRNSPHRKTGLRSDDTHPAWLAQWKNLAYSVQIKSAVRQAYGVVPCNFRLNALPDFCNCPRMSLHLQQKAVPGLQMMKDFPYRNSPHWKNQSLFSRVKPGHMTLLPYGLQTPPGQRQKQIQVACRMYGQRSFLLQNPGLHLPHLYQPSKLPLSYDPCVHQMIPSKRILFSLLLSHLFLF